MAGTLFLFVISTDCWQPSLCCGVVALKVTDSHECFAAGPSFSKHGSITSNKTVHDVSKPCVPYPLPPLFP
jgi:hypothetical protein